MQGNIEADVEFFGMPMQSLLLEEGIEDQPTSSFLKLGPQSHFQAPFTKAAPRVRTSSLAVLLNIHDARVKNFHIKLTVVNTCFINFKAFAT